MLPSYFLALREGIEAALIIGIVLSTLRHIRMSQAVSQVWSGATSAGILSVGIALLLYRFDASLTGVAEKLFEGITMLLAGGILSWMIFWMLRQAQNIKSNLEHEVRKATTQKGKNALFALAFLAVLREGIELALFLTAAAFASNAQDTLFGALLGMTTAILLGWSLFASLIKLDLSRFFKVTGIILILFAAGLVAHGVHEFNEIGWIPNIIEHVWNLNPLLNENSTLGEMLKALFGYNGDPSLTEVIAYLGYFVAVGFGLRRQQKITAATQKS